MSPEQLQARRRLSMDGVHRIKTSQRMHGERIAIVGVGRTGLPLAILAASKRIDVVAFDIDAVKIAQLERREAHFLDDESAHAFKRARTLTLTANESSLAHADTFIICVSTPIREDRRADMRPLEAAARAVGRYLRAGNLVVVETAVNPGVCEHFVLPTLEKESGLSRNDFYFAHVPGPTHDRNETTSLAHAKRIAGGQNAESISAALVFYKKILDAEPTPMHSMRETEAVQLVERAQRDVGAALVNELAIAFERAQIDIVPVLAAAASQSSGLLTARPSATETPPRFNIPSYLMRRGHENDFEHQLLALARRVNDGMPLYTIRILTDALRERRKRIKGATIALLGLPKAADETTDEGTGATVRDALVKKGAHVQVFDPFIANAGRDLKETLRGADAVIIAADVPMFSHLLPRQFEEFGISIVIDACNCLDAAAFKKSSILYRGIGR